MSDSARTPKKLRALREGEAFCKHGCKTIVEALLGSCEMCCEKAIADRVARLAPIIKDNLAKAAEKSKRLQAILDKRKAARDEREKIAERIKAEIALEAATAPKGKR